MKPGVEAILGIGLLSFGIYMITNGAVFVIIMGGGFNFPPFFLFGALGISCGVFFTITSAVTIARSREA